MAPSRRSGPPPKENHGGSGSGSGRHGGVSVPAASTSASSRPRFTDAQLDEMLYEWDEDAYPVMEYHVAGTDGGPNKAAAAAGAAGAGETKKDEGGDGGSGGDGGGGDEDDGKEDADAAAAAAAPEQEEDPINSYDDDDNENLTPEERVRVKAANAIRRKARDEAREAERKKALLHDGEANARKTYERTEVNLDEIGGGGKNRKSRRQEKKVYLDLNTDEVAHVVELYEPWCPHCQALKPHYIDMAKEVDRRAIGTKVQFHAVSCELYRDLCRTYEVSSYPTILGYPVGSDTFEIGVELNEEGWPELTADRLAHMMDVELAHEARSFWTSSYSDSEDQAEHLKRIEDNTNAAVKTKTAWHEYKSTVNDRYHNAGLSLAFALKSGVYDRFGELDDNRALVLSDFMALVDWATPQSWPVRTGLVKELKLRFRDVVISGRDNLVDLVERNQALHEESVGDRATEHLWGHVDVPKRQKRKKRVTALGGDVPDAKRHGEITDRNRRWTEACTHSKPAMGYTCGLWDLFHMITIGASLPEHQLYGFHAGYITSPHEVAATIRNFVGHFFACDVCRWNFLDAYDSCAHGRCDRLAAESPVVLGTRGGVGRGAALSREVSLWLFEVHNAVNVRIMKESAERDGRVVTEAELLAGRWPTARMCPRCWIDVKEDKYDPDAVYDFLKNWYWPHEETIDDSFNAILTRRVAGSGVHRYGVGLKRSSSNSTFGPFLTTLALTGVIVTAVIKVIKSVDSGGAGGGGRRRTIEDLKKHPPPRRNGTPYVFKRPPPRP